jgi:hypothetical protein
VKVKTPVAAKEDPAVTAAREREQARADAAFIGNTQGLLDDENRKRGRRFGRRVALTGADPSAGPSGNSTASVTGTPLVAGSVGSVLGGYGYGGGGAFGTSVV